MRKVLRQLSYVLSGKEKRNGAILLLIMMIGALTEVIGVGAIPAFIGVISVPEKLLEYEFVRSTYDALGVDSERSMILWGAVGLILVFVAKNAYLTFLAYVRARYATKRQSTISNRLFTAYLNAPYTFHLQKNTSELLRNASRDAADISKGVIIPMLSILMETMVLLFIFGLLFVLEPLLSLVTFAVFGTLTYLFWKATRTKIRALATDEQKHRQLAIQAVNQGLGGFKDARVLGREDYFGESFSVSANRQAEAARFKEFLQALPRLFLETVAIFGLLGVAALFVFQERDLRTIVPTLALIAVAVVRLMPSFTKIANNTGSMQWGMRALDVVYTDLITLETLKTSPSETMNASLLFESKIEITNLIYGYPGQNGAALHNVSLTIPKNASVGFVGPSGSGKTTIVDVILGLLPPESGRVLVDGIDIYDNLEAWQRRIGYIPQQIFLTDDSVRRNVAFGRDDEEIDDEAVWASLEAAQLRDLVESLPEGLDTSVGERGVRLSGGQRQRIGIARALYHKPEILIMDEATSALDNQTESQFVEALENLQDNHTLIMIAHRLSTVRNCDILFMLNEGKLVAQGTFDELMEGSVTFRQMAAFDAREYLSQDHPPQAPLQAEPGSLPSLLRWN